jgi:tetratricopeptide (TPR) repeat protein
VHDDTLNNLLEKADSLIDVERANEALTLLQEAARLAPDNSDVLCRMSVAYITLEEWNAALNNSNLAVIASPDEEWGHRLCSIALLKLGNPHEGLRAAEAAVNLDADNAKCALALAQAQLGCKLYDLAEVSAWRVVHLEPDEADGYVVLAQLCIDRSIWNRAEEYARKALEIEPHNSAAITYTAVALASGGNRRAALPFWVRVLQEDPTNAPAQKIVLQHFSWFPYLVGPSLLIMSWVTLGRLKLSGLSSFALALVATVSTCMMLFKFWPQVMLYTQPSFWKLPLTHRMFVSRTWQKEWLKRSGNVVVMTGLIFGFIVAIVIALVVIIAFPPIGGIWFLTGLFSKQRSQARAEARQRKLAAMIRRFLP